jgi:protein O-GlcNAc transferase
MHRTWENCRQSQRGKSPLAALTIRQNSRPTSSRLGPKYCCACHIRNQFAAASVDPLRVYLEGEADHASMLAAYQRIDLALDTQPYSGGLTTCESLWMGVPVITYPGKTFAGRHSTSHLMNAGFGQFVAKDRTSYIDLAVAWANRLGELSKIRSAMREQMRQSPLCDAQRFAKDFLTVLRAAWNERVGASRT